jgi:hypothetical protein
MKWIVMAIFVISALLASDHRVWFVPAAFGIGMLGWWYWFERQSEAVPDVSLRGQTSAHGQQSSIGLAPPYMEPFLWRLSSLMKGGYSPEEIDHIVGLAVGMKPDEKHSLKYEVDFMGQRLPLNIELCKAGRVEVAIRFQAPPPLADFIEHEMESFFAGRDLRTA